VKLRCLRPFKYAADHLNNVRIVPGEVVDLPQPVADSLMTEHYVEAWWPDDGEGRPQVKMLGPAPENKRGRPRK
jgi:hypothetical protein